MSDTRYTPEEYEDLFYNRDPIVFPGTIKETTILKRDDEEVVIQFGCESDGKVVSFERVFKRGIRCVGDTIDIKHNYVDEKDFKEILDYIRKKECLVIDGSFSFFDCGIDLKGLELPTCIFSATIFNKNANFSESKFSGDAKFSESKFSGDVNFFKSKFSGDAYFSYSKFSGKADFSESEFEKVLTYAISFWPEDAR